MATKSTSASRNAAVTAGQPINLPAAIIVKGSGGELHQHSFAGQPILTTNFGTLVAERVVDARGHAAHSYFELTDSLGDYTTARILTETGVCTPVFTRFSTVAGHSTAARPLLDAAGVMDDAGIVALAINGGAQGFATLAGKGRIWAREPNVRTVY